MLLRHLHKWRAPELARADFNKVFEEKPDTKIPRLYRGITFLRLERYEEAVADLEKYLEHFPEKKMELRPLLIEGQQRLELKLHGARCSNNCI